MFLRLFLAPLLFCLLAGCTPQREADKILPATITKLVVQTIFPVATSTQKVTPSVPTATSTPEIELCSPLQGVPLSQMSSLVSNPFHPPAPGSDEPHQGVDLAVRLPGSQIAVAGAPVQAALEGRVAMVTRDRFPFGNAVIIETPLEALPEAWQAGFSIPTPAPTLAPRSALTCPHGPPPTIPNPQRRSLYVLYAHLQAPAVQKPGDTLACGQTFGAVGMSGNALNPHLHFEAKVGPSRMRIPSMAHYDASATLDEMRNYCLWSVSGLFQLVDPMKILQYQP